MGKLRTEEELLNAAQWMAEHHKELRWQWYEPFPGVISAWFIDDQDAKKIWYFHDILTSFYHAMMSGPEFINATGKPNILSFKFESDSELDKVARDYFWPSQCVKVI